MLVEDGYRGEFVCIESRDVATVAVENSEPVKIIIILI